MKVQRTKSGDLIVKDKHTFNSAVIGMLLGDASLDRFRYVSGPFGKSKKGPYWNRTVLRFSHKEDHSEYLFWKIALIKPYVDSFSVYDKSKAINGKVFKSKEALVRHRKNFHYLYKDFYIGGEVSTGNRISGAKKTVKGHVLNRLDDLSLALWYMDDGSLYTNRNGSLVYYSLSLHTDCFTEEECYLIKSFFSCKYGIDFSVNHNCTTKSNVYGFKLRASSKENVFSFFDVVSPIVKEVDCMKYKLPQ